MVTNAKKEKKYLHDMVFWEGPMSLHNVKQEHKFKIQ